MMPQRFGVEASLRVEERQRNGHQAAGEQLIASLGSDICIDPRLLTEYCFSKLDARTQDLMTVLGAIRWADRSVRRHHSEGWSRKLDLEIPVFERDVWSGAAVTGSLGESLNYLTGDEWSFAFRKRRKAPTPIGQSCVEISSNRECVFVPYSHGLDSYAQVRLLENVERQTDIVCVFTDTKPNNKTWKEFCRQRPKGGIRDIRVPVTVVEPHHAEPSFRTRPFLYYVLSACGALLSSKRVLIPENGQGSIGGSLVPLGAEAKHRSCHPGFTTRLGNFLYHLTGEKIAFEHPALYATKGEVLARLATVDVNSGVWLAEHWSCSHDQRHSAVAGARVHCGVCGNCLLRRASTLAAGIQDTTTYKFANLNSTDLISSVDNASEPQRYMKAFEDLVGNTIRGMQRLAVLADDPDHTMLWSQAAELARAQNRQPADAHVDLVRLVKQHAVEWRAFADTNSRGWFSQMLRDGS